MNDAYAFRSNVYKSSVSTCFDVLVVREAIVISFMERLCHVRNGHSIQVFNCKGGLCNICNIFNIRVEMNLSEAIHRFENFCDDVLIFDTHTLMKNVTRR